MSPDDRSQRHSVRRTVVTGETGRRKRLHNKGREVSPDDRSQRHSVRWTVVIGGMGRRKRLHNEGRTRDN